MDKKQLQLQKTEAKQNGEITKPLVTPAEKVFNSIKFIKEINQIEIMNNILKKTYFSCGQVPEKKDFDNLCSLILIDINNNFRKITTLGLRIAFDKGVKKDYGDYYGINLITCNQWIKSYLVSDFRLNKLNEIKMEPKEIDKKKLNDEFLNNCLFRHYDNYKNGGVYKFSPTSITDKNNGLFEILRGVGLCKFKDPLLSEIIKEAKEMELSILKNKYLENPLNKKVKNLINEIKGGGSVDSWKRYARIIGFKKQIEMLVEMDFDIKDYFD